MLIFPPPHLSNELSSMYDISMNAISRHKERPHHLRLLGPAEMLGSATPEGILNALQLSTLILQLSPKPYMPPKIFFMPF